MGQIKHQTKYYQSNWIIKKRNTKQMKSIFAWCKKKKKEVNMDTIIIIVGTCDCWD